MTRYIQLLLTFITLLPSNLVLAQSEAEETDTSVASTPRSMAELLPKGGAGELEYDFYMLGQSGNGGEADWDHCLRYTGQKVDGLFVVSNLYDDLGDIQWITRLSYNERGELELFRDQLIDLNAVFGGDNITERRGKPYFAHIYAEVKQVDRSIAGRKTGEINTQYYTRRYRPSEIMGNLKWMPLIFAYHFRQGHQRFSVKQHVDEQQGAQQVEFDGKTRTARVLLVRNAATGKAHCLLRVFENGEYYSIDLLGAKDPNYVGPFASTQQRVTPAQLEEMLDIKLDENGDPPKPWSADDQSDSDNAAR